MCGNEFFFFQDAGLSVAIHSSAFVDIFLCVTETINDIKKKWILPATVLVDSKEYRKGDEYVRFRDNSVTIRLAEFF